MPSRNFTRRMAGTHTVNPSSEMIGALYISGKNIFWSTHVYKNRERKIFEILRCPFELPAKQHRPVSPSWPNGRCCLAGNSKGHRRISKIFLSLFLYTAVIITLHTFPFL